MNAAGLAQRSLAPVKTSAIGHSLAFEEHLTASGVASRTTHLVPPILRVSPAGVACGSYNYQNATLYGSRVRQCIYAYLYGRCEDTPCARTNDLCPSY